VLVLLLMLFDAATLLRLNNIGMAERREAVLDADKAGNPEKLSRAVSDLKNYVFSHMNASTGTFYLENQYQRDARAVLDKAKKASESGSDRHVYRKVANHCDAQAKRFGWGYSQPYFDCIARELKKYGAAKEIQDQVTLPNVELYALDYASPLWSPSLAGLTVLVCLVLAGILLAKFVVFITLNLILWSYKKQRKTS
jgi:hypothetical protein